MNQKLLIYFMIATAILIQSSAWIRIRRRSRRCDTTACLWSWRSCSRTCGGGIQSAYITRNKGECGPACNLPSPRSCNTNCCPVNCRWGLWGTWGSCSRSCGGGIALRSRHHSSTASCGGSVCTGSSSESRSCQTNCCPVNCVWGAWNNWGSCSVSCGGGILIRNRNIAVNAFCGGSTCIGESTDSIPCSQICCPVNCRWGLWGSWGSCSRSCGGGTAIRTRITSQKAACGGSACTGSTTESRSCGTNCCPVNCRWGSWRSWSSCSRSCGGGTAVRTRTYSQAVACGGSVCTGSNIAIRSCGRYCCPVNCVWGPWNSWGSCSASCGGGISTRNRVIAVNATCGGSTCTGLFTDSVPCSTQCCPVNCEWDNWGEYSSCSQSCGSGIKSRIRSIRMEESCGGNPCSGSNQDQVSCNTMCCPVDCVWDAWSSYGPCSVTCGAGIKQRTRSYATESSCGGNPCPGKATDIANCSTVPCPIHCQWGPWNNWESCSVSCDGGIQSRNRSVITSAQHEGMECIGDRNQVKRCNDVCCPVDCVWADWSLWDSCSASCEGGLQARKRNISTENQCGGSECHGNSSESRVCNDVCCPVDCLLSEWSEWDSCNVTCGTGTQSRSRVVERTESCEGSTCVGALEESRNCNTQCCSVSCQLSDWENWGDCSKTCGPHGVSTRNRSIAVTEKCGGEPCVGDLQEAIECNNFCMNEGQMANETCVCKTGWSGECCENDLNECEEMNHNCSENAICTDSDGSYDCTCMKGYTGNGSVCEDIDECKLNPSPCQEETMLCKNIPGSFKCYCTSSFELVEGRCVARTDNNEALKLTEKTETFNWKIIVYVVIGIFVIAAVSFLVAFMFRRIRNKKYEIKGNSFTKKLDNDDMNSNAVEDKDL